jgi:site-specific recombinase XerD
MLYNGIDGQIVQEIGINTGISKYQHVHPHGFRHGFAINYINSGGSLSRLMKTLGHSNIQTTMRYLRFADEDLKRDFERMNF